MDAWFLQESVALAAEVVSCGKLVGDTKVAIVNPENLTKCRADEIGEIWVSDPARGSRILESAGQV